MKNLIMKNSKYFFLAILASSLFFTSCDDDDGAGPVDPQEVITTVELTLTNGGNSSTFTIRDTDGDGGNPPEKETIQVDANTVYGVSVRFLDESNPNDVEDITEEVQEESEEHLVCYSGTGEVTTVTPTGTDSDTAGFPLGLMSSLSTEQAGMGTFTVVLKHEPTKTVVDMCSTGDTDVEVTFDVEVQ